MQSRREGDKKRERERKPKERKSTTRERERGREKKVLKDASFSYDFKTFHARVSVAKIC